MSTKTKLTSFEIIKNYLIEEEKVSQQTFNQLNYHSNIVWNFIYFGPDYQDYLLDNDPPACKENSDLTLQHHRRAFREIFNECSHFWRDYWYAQDGGYVTDQEPIFDLEDTKNFCSEELKELCCDLQREEFLRGLEEDFYMTWSVLDIREAVKEWLNEDTYSYMF